MLFTLEELNLIRQWFNAVEDATPEYLEDADRKLGKRIAEFVARQYGLNQRSEPSP